MNERRYLEFQGLLHHLLVYYDVVMFQGLLHHLLVYYDVVILIDDQRQQKVAHLAQLAHLRDHLDGHHLLRVHHPHQHHLHLQKEEKR